MSDPKLEQDRRSGIALMSFVTVQIVYLVIQLVVMSPPALAFDKLGELKTFIAENAGILRGHTLLSLVAFVFLFVPGALGFRRRLARSAPENGLLSDVVGVGIVLILISVFIGATSYAVMGAPGGDLSDSVLQAYLMDNNYAIFVPGSFAIALFVGSSSLVMLRVGGGPRWLSWWGLATAAVSLVGALWIISADLEGALYGISLLARASFLAWIVATGVWLVRSATTGGSPTRIRSDIAEMA